MMNKPAFQLICILFLISLLFFNRAMPVSAEALGDERNPTAQPTGGTTEQDIPLPDRWENILSRAYQAEGKLMNHIQRDLGHAAAWQERIQAGIQRMGDQGHDTQEAEEALRLFAETVSQLQTEFAAGVSMYQSHPGFDEQGAVLDAALAKETIKTVKDSFLGTHRGWHRAVDDLRKILEPYRTPHASV